MLNDDAGDNFLDLAFVGDSLELIADSSFLNCFELELASANSFNEFDDSHNVSAAPVTLVTLKYKL